MSGEQNKMQKYFLSVTMLGAFLVIFLYLLVNNIRLKANLSELSSPIMYDQNANENQSQEQNSNELVVINEEHGVWDKEGKARLELVHELTIGDEEENPNTIFHYAGPVKSDVEGNIYVAESWTQKTCTIRKFDSNGNYLLTIGRKGQGPGEFLGVFNFEFEQDTILTVFDPGTLRITRFSCSGDYLNSIPIQLRGIGAPEEAFYGCAIDGEGSYFLSFYDHNSDKVIHKFHSTGEYVTSFGTPFKFKTVHSGYIEMSHKRDLAPGKLILVNEDLFFSQNNPYAIKGYHLDGVMKMKIIRKNSFMPPAKVEIKGNNSYKFWIPSQSTGLGVWHNMLINCVWVPSHVDERIGAVVDIFTLDGQLLSSITLEENILFTHIDKQGKLYGIEKNDNFGERVVRYALKFK